VIPAVVLGGFQKAACVPERGKNPKSLTDQLMGIMAASTRPWDGRESEGLAGATFTKPVIRSAFQPPNFEFTHFSYVLQGRLRMCCKAVFSAIFVW
jgi:hypothetical protein